MFSRDQILINPKSYGLNAYQRYFMVELGLLFGLKPSLGSNALKDLKGDGGWNCHWFIASYDQNTPTGIQTNPF